MALAVGNFVEGFEPRRYTFEVMRMLVFGIACILASPLHAATFTVNATDDRRDATPGDGICDTGGGTCTLRAAVQEANALGGSHQIVLPAGPYRLTLPGRDDDASAGDLDVLGTLQITGAGAGATSIDAGKINDRAFDVQPGGVLDIGDVTIRHGHTAGAGYGGGGLRTMGTLMLHDAVITGCRSDEDAGAVDVQQGMAVLTTVRLVRNRAGDDGGAISNDGGLVTLTDVRVVRNRAANGGGGLMNSGGEMILQQVRIIQNRATIDGGGISIERGAVTTIDGCLIAGNNAKRGGGLFSDDARGQNTTTVSGTTLKHNTTDDCSGPIIDGGGNTRDRSCGFAANAGG
jgi:CSLREA domain-containing protein